MSQLLDYLVENEPSFRKARLPALYSDFTPLRTLNPDGYTANISAWRRALSLLVRSGLAPSPRGAAPSLLVLNSSEQLLRALETKQYGRPLALGTVLHEAVEGGDLIALGDFLRRGESIYKKPGWVSGVSVWGVVGWVGGRLPVVGGLFRGGGEKLPEGQFVVVGLVEELGRKFEEMRGETGTGRMERIFTKGGFVKEFGGELVKGRRLAEGDVDVFLRFLARDKGVVVYDGSTVKIKAVGQGDGEGEITAEDTSIASLKELLAGLTQETALLGKRVEEFANKAKQAVAKKNLIAARAALKFKKQTEMVLEKRFASMAQLQDIAANIEQAATNVEMVKIMESSEQVLASLNKEIGGVERVESLVEKLQEQKATVEEVQGIITEMGDVVVDDEELDDELAAMESEEKAKVEEAERKKKEEEKKRLAASQAKEAEETRRRLEEAGEVPQSEKTEEQKKAAEETLQAENMLSRLSLEEKVPEKKEREQPLAA